MSELKIGIIGCGGRIRNVVNRVLSFTDGGASVRSVFDPRESSVNKARELYGDSILVQDSYEDLVKDREIDWVFVGSWNCFHKDQTIAAFNAGKNVFCEKPLATSLKDCVAIREAWKTSGKEFVIGFTLRFSPHYRKIRELLDAGEIGDLISMEFNETLPYYHGGYIHGDWRRKTEWSGSHLLEKCCHDIDLANWFVQSKPVRVASFGGTDFFLPKNEHHIERMDRLNNDTNARSFQYPGNENPFTADKDVVDNQVAIIEFENKVRTTFHTNCNCAIPERRIYLCGTHGTIRADVIPGTIELQKTGWNTERQTIETGSSGGHGGGDDILGREVAECMLKGNPSSATLEDGFLAALTAFGIDQAMAQGRVVDMRELWDQAGL